jgi:hypothetical protein
MWKRWLILAVCLVLIVARFIWPDAKVDTTTIWLVVIAVLLFVLPDLKALAPFIKRIKIGEAEVELKDQIQKLSSEVAKAEEASQKLETKQPRPDTTKKVSIEIDSVLESLQQDPRATLLLLSSRIERHLRDRLEEAGVSAVDRTYALGRLAELGVRSGVFPEEFYPAFRDFVAVRNRVAHGEAFDVDDNLIYSLISLGSQLLRIVSVPFAKKKQE